MGIEVVILKGISNVPLKVGEIGIDVVISLVGEIYSNVPLRTGEMGIEAVILRGISNVPLRTGETTMELSISP